MDAYQQPHHPMRPATPQPPADPHQYHHYQQQQQQPPPPIQPVAPQGSWYSNQFHYHPSSHSPSPPPQWAPPPPPPPQSDHHPPFSSSYPPPSRHPPYPAPLPSHGNRFPHPPHSRPHLPPQIPQSYHQVNQEWGSSNWGHQHAWDYPAAHNMEVDWAEKARAWASAKAAMDDQHPQSQFTSTGRHEEQGGFHDHHPQAVNYPYQDVQQQSVLPSNHQQFPVPSTHHRPPMVYMQETSSMNFDASSYLPNGHLPYAAKDGISHAAFSHQESFPTSSSVHQQEVPSSYSSVAGKEEIIEQKDQLYKSLISLPNSSAQDGQHLVQPSLPALSRSVLTEQPLAYGNHMANPSTDLSDQPLHFAPGFNHDRDALMQPGYATHHDSAVTERGIDPVAVGAPINSWAPSVVPGAVYPPIPPVIPSGPQQDVSVSVSGNAILPPLGRFPGPSFQPTLPSTGAPYGLGPGPALNSSTAFPGDAYGSVSERPKKASVPNWLKEEIIKNASVITKSSMEHPKEDTQSIEDEGVDRSSGNGDQADSKSIDSSRSTEEEDEEDYQEAAKSAAINQEIKRVLTEVLLKVTDELFDEIATEVIDEYDLPVEADQDTPSLNHKVSPPSVPADPIPRAPAKAVVPVKARDSGTEVVSETPSSSSHGNVLGLANYDSGDDIDDDNENGDKEIQNSSEPNSVKNAFLARADNKNLPRDKHGAVENSGLLVGLKEHGAVVKDLLGGLNKSSSLEPRNNENTALRELTVDTEVKEYEHASLKVTSQGRSDIDFGKAQDGYNGSGPEGMLGEQGVNAENPSDNVHAKRSAVDDPHFRETRTRPDQYDRNENKKYGKDFVKGAASRSREDEKQGEHRKRHDEKHLRKENTNDHDQNGSKERMKQRDAKSGERSEESESRKRSAHHDTKDDKKEADRLHRTNPKEGTNKKRESTNSKEEGDARHNLSSDLRRHKRRRSSSISSRGRNSKENLVNDAHDSSDDESDDSKRKLHSRRRNLSPSPVRSRRRQLSRSPHSKHSQRRHSPYSSLETNRGRRRSGSRSPMRRKR